MNKDQIYMMSLISGLEEAKRCIEKRLEEVRSQLVQSGASITTEPIKKTRNISDETREQRRKFLAEARNAKLARLYAKKAGMSLEEKPKEEDSQGQTKNKSSGASGGGLSSAA